jgi:signal transduction histidine kinase
MERFFEKERKEGISRQETVAALRQNPHNLDPLTEYQNSREAACHTSKDFLGLNIDTARIYKEAGLIDAAIAAYEDAIEQALQEREDDLCTALENELDEIGGL